MTKNKKIIVSIAGIAAGIGIISSLLYGKINIAENEYVLVTSAIQGIKDNTMRDKQELLNMQYEMAKLDKDKTINIDEILEEIEKEDYNDNTKLNYHVKQLDRLNKEIDNMIYIYNEDEKMKNDMKITETMMNIEGLDNIINSTIDSYNTDSAPKFNEAIKKFPVNIIAKNKGWFTLDKFSSVK